MVFAHQAFGEVTHPAIWSGSRLRSNKREKPTVLTFAAGSYALMLMPGKLPVSSTVCRRGAGKSLPKFIANGWPGIRRKIPSRLKGQSRSSIAGSGTTLRITFKSPGGPPPNPSMPNPRRVTISPSAAPSEISTATVRPVIVVTSLQTP